MKPEPTGALHEAGVVLDDHADPSSSSSSSTPASPATSATRRPPKARPRSASAARSGAGSSSTRRAIARLGELTLELGRPYKMIISSEDVLHSFYIPEFRMKRDAVRGSTRSSSSPRPRRGERARLLRRVLRHQPLRHARDGEGSSAGPSTRSGRRRLGWMPGKA